jgi:hypothetical protein
MRRIFIILMVVMLAMALMVGACGKNALSPSSSGTSGGGGQAATMSADDVMAKVTDSSSSIKSVSFVADLTLAVKADTAKLTDPQSKALVQSPIALHAEGSISKEPQAADMSMTVDVAGQNLPVGIRFGDNKAWVQFQNKWYATPPDQVKSLQGKVTGTPEDTLAQFGIDPMSWSTERTVTMEQLDGKSVYHVVSQADPKKVVADIVKAMNQPGLTSGSSAATIDQLKKQNQAQIKELEDSLKAVTAEYWIDASSFYIVKGLVTANMVFSGQIKNQGLNGADLKVTYSADKFNEPVNVQAPPNALPFDQLSQALLGGMGSGSGL